MTEDKSKEDEKWKDGALLEKLKVPETKERFYRRLDDRNDLLWVQELFKGNMHIRIFQSTEQTLLYKGPLSTIDKFLEFAEDGLYRNGWSKKLLEILRNPEVKKEQLANYIEPTDEEIELFKEKCGPTGCFVLKLIEKKCREDIKSLNLKLQTAFKVYYEDRHTNMIPNITSAGFRSLNDKGDDLGVADLFQKMQSRREKNPEDGLRLMVCNQDSNVSSSQIAKLFQHHALERNMICLHYNWDEGQTRSDQVTFPEFVIKRRLTDHDQLHGKDVSRAYNYVVNHFDKVMVIVEGLHCKVDRRHGVTEEGWVDTPFNHMCSLVLKHRLRGAYKVLIWDGDKMEQKIGQLLRSNLPDMYAVFEQKD